MLSLKRVVDASVVLAVLKQEAGSKEASLKMRGGFISAVNLSEVYYKSAQVNKLNLAEAIVQTAELSVEPFDQRQARISAGLFEATKGKGISFADRACLALSMSEETPVLTGDHRWSELELSIEFEFFRARSN